jgi:hypothetical protein
VYGTTILRMMATFYQEDFKIPSWVGKKRESQEIDL